MQNFDEILGVKDTTHQIQEDDVMTLINTLILNTKSETIQNTSGDPFWGATCCSLKRTA